MNKTVLTVGSAVLGGAVSKGITGMLEVSNPVKIIMSLVLCAGSGYLASQVKGTDTKASLLQGAYMGIAITQGLETVKAVASIDAIANKLNPETKFGKFAQKSLGLSGAYGMLNSGYTDNDGNYHDDSLAGYLSAGGDVVAYGDALNGTYFDENGNQVSDGLNANFEDEALNADYEDESLNGDFEDDALNGDYEDEALNGDYDDEALYADFEAVD